jgi:hypothetical protein
MRFVVDLEPEPSRREREECAKHMLEEALRTDDAVLAMLLSQAALMILIAFDAVFDRVEPIRRPAPH